MPVHLDTILTFAIASLALLISPGPTIVMVVSQALTHGRRVALASVFGVGLGDVVAASISLMGVGTLLAASATAFTVLKLLGAAYLIYMGIRMWRAPMSDLVAATGLDQQASSRRVFRDAFLVTLFNPKSIIFFVAFVPQFIDHTRPFAPQAATLVAVFVGLGIVNSWAYAVAAARARGLIGRPKLLRRASRFGASFLIGAGLASALARRA
ncbi:LysE family translocator [Mangrovibrevibacter kandeliae]|uniref:LysE family translocator n=1 Tax=Mangrovibrevibacter kandeliae TaxID=2968473 RepID=UPI002117DA19|nr:LysE family translocator [Aurantimonas sp. CSK15Z-1]MCQ8780796.1 LysE family translocator [Aurantimonas sp. CSK15Z-1]